jgi:hypothetical protein
MAHILIITLSDIRNDPRVSRQIISLSHHHTLSVAGRGGYDFSGIHFIPIISRERTLTQKVQGAWLLKTNQFAKYYWGLPDIKDALQKLNKIKFDLILANDVETLPLALEVAAGAKIMLDAHEYSPQEFEDRWVWSFFSRKYVLSFLCKRHLQKLDGMMTVCKGLAEEYSRNFSIPEPFIVLNAPYRQELDPQPCREQIRMIHHGIAIPSRKLELMIDLMDNLEERFSLDIMLLEKNPEYLIQLKNKAAANKRIRFIPPVPMSDIPQNINQYDIGLFLLPPKNINYAYALPNKFFEFIQARLAVAIGPSPEMERYVRQYNCGIVSPDFTPEQMARELNKLTIDGINQYKQNADRAAQKLCFETSEQVLLKRIHTLLAD